MTPQGATGAVGAQSGQGGAGGVGEGGIGGVGNGATGGAGGNGGTVTVDAGTFNMSNNITSSFTNGAGIMVSSQNSGMSSLVQQSVNVQANMNVGK